MRSGTFSLITSTTRLVPERSLRSTANDGGWWSGPIGLSVNCWRTGQPKLPVGVPHLMFLSRFHGTHFIDCPQVHCKVKGGQSGRPISWTFERSASCGRLSRYTPGSSLLFQLVHTTTSGIRCSDPISAASNHQTPGDQFPSSS